jgi:predicted transport protein
MNIILNGNKFKQIEYKSENIFEEDITNNSKNLFGDKSVYINYKRKINTKNLGGSIPDGFLLNLTDIENPIFYLVEVELATHDFYGHIFPQITKFFAFFKNSQSRNDLLDKIYSIIQTDENIQNEIKKLANRKEIYKLIKDAIEDNPNILLIIDDNKQELPEIIDTYTDTWGKILKLEIIKKYVNGNDIIFSMDPEFETLDYYIESNVLGGIGKADIGDDVVITENTHLSTFSDKLKEIYNRLKNEVDKLDPNLIFNPQKYYISIKKEKNIVYIEPRKKKFRLVIMLEAELIKQNIKKCEITELSQSVQGFYNGSCAAIDLDELNKVEEIINLLKIIIAQNQPKNY